MPRESKQIEDWQVDNVLDTKIMADVTRSIMGSRDRLTMLRHLL